MIRCAGAGLDFGSMEETVTCSLHAARVAAAGNAAAGGGEGGEGGGHVLVTLTSARKPFHYERDFEVRYGCSS